MNKPFVSIIIPNLNNQDRLDLCLAALQQQTYPKASMEIIVVDNGSRDKSAEISKKYPVQWLTWTNYQSPYPCRNLGIQKSKGTIIALLDSNCVPVPTWLESGVETLQSTDAAIVTGPVRFNFSPKNTVAERIDYLYSVVTADDIPITKALPATHLFMEKVLFERIGYFIPHIRSLGDIEWTQRARDQGYAFGFEDRAGVDYPAKPFTKAVKKMIRLGGGQKELYVAKGKSVYHPQWILRIGKNLLPPSPQFYREMIQRNKSEKTGLSPITLFLGLYGIKLCYAWGMIFKRPIAPLPENA